MLAGICVGLGFETKMGVALFTVPGCAAAWIWVRVLGQPARRARLRAFGQLLWGGVAMLIVGLAWPVLVMLTPATDRPWISGTSDNSIWSLIFGYNGLGRVAGQTGGPGGGAGRGGGGPGGSLFGGATGPFRLLQSGLGDQAGWLLGFALVSATGLVVLTRLRRRDPRTGWLIAIGGAFACTAVVFSFASGIFHPYYVSLLAPLTAALVGAGVGEALGARRTAAARWIGPAAILAGAVTELVVIGGLGSGGLGWAPAVVLAGALVGAGALALLAARAAAAGGPGGRRRGAARRPGRMVARHARPLRGLDLPGRRPGIDRPRARWTRRVPRWPREVRSAARAPAGSASRRPAARAVASADRLPGVGGPGGPFGGDSTSLTAAVAYARAHGGGNDRGGEPGQRRSGDPRLGRAGRGSRRLLRSREHGLGALACAGGRGR